MLDITIRGIHLGRVVDILNHHLSVETMTTTAKNEGMDSVEWQRTSGDIPFYSGKLVDIHIEN